METLNISNSYHNYEFERKLYVDLLTCNFLYAADILVCWTQGGKGRNSHHCGVMIQWLWGDPIIALWGNDQMVACRFF